MIDSPHLSSFISSFRRTLSVLMAAMSIGVFVMGAKADDQLSAPRFPKFVSRYDLATRTELQYTYWIEPLVKDEDVSEWSWITDLTDELGTWATAYIDAQKITDALQNGLPIGGQPPLSRLQSLVDECALLLNIKAPTVIVRNAPETRAYVVATDRENLLVLTSGTLKLFDGAEDELKFVIGRELGRIKCEHLRIRRAAYGLLTVLHSIDQTAIPVNARRVLPSLAAGRILTWSREAEISADRAGLICCGTPEIATSALIRLLHGLDKNAKILDPKNPMFDADRIVENFQRWENEPIYRFVTLIQSGPKEVPFIADRLAALLQYARSDQYLALLNRPAPKAGTSLAIVEDISLDGLTGAGTGVVPYVKCFAGGKGLFRSPTYDKRGQSANWVEITTIASETDGLPLFFEVFDDGWIHDTLIGGFTIYPHSADAQPVKSPSGRIAAEATYTTHILWDWRSRSTVTRTGVARVRVRFASTEHAK